MAPNQDRRTIGVLALQGAFAEHQTLFGELPSNLAEQISVVQVRTGEQLRRCDALVIPGGESTTMKIVAQDNGACEGFKQDLVAFVHGGPDSDGIVREPRPVWGTCAGCILLSNDVVDGLDAKDSVTEEPAKKRPKYGDQVCGLDVSTCRNFFGRQVASFEVPVTAPTDASGAVSRAFSDYPAVFIRAPAILRVGPGVRVLARAAHPAVEAAGVGDDAGVVVAAASANLMVTCFHPELSPDSRIHRYFVEEFVLPPAAEA